MIQVSKRQLAALLLLTELCQAEIANGVDPDEPDKQTQLKHVLPNPLGDLFEIECKLNQAIKSNSPYISIVN